MRSWRAGPPKRRAGNLWEQDKLIIPKTVQKEGFGVGSYFSFLSSEGESRGKVLANQSVLFSIKLGSGL